MSSGEPSDDPRTAAALEAVLVQVLAAVVTLAHDRFLLEVHTSRRPEGVYVQGLLEEDGSLFVEAPSNQFLPIPLTGREVEQLIVLGWQPPEENLPNYWRLIRADGIVPGHEAAVLARTLIEVYGATDADEITLRPADLAEDAVPAEGVVIVSPDSEPAQPEPVPASGTLHALLHLAGATEVDNPVVEPWRLFRFGVSGAQFAVTPGDDARLLVEVPELDPTGQNRTWRAETSPYLTQTGPSLSGTGSSLWLATMLDPRCVTLADLPSTVAALAAAARDLPQRAVDISAVEQRQAELWQELESIDADAAALMHLLQEGDPLGVGPAQDRGLSRRGGREYVVGANWHIPQEVSTPALGVRWLTNRYPPDCGRLFAGTDSLIVTGAIGWIALAVEDTPEAAGRSSLFRTLSLELRAATKAASIAQRVMPKGQFGWLRPILLEGSARTGSGRVLRYDRTLEQMVEDQESTEAWQALLRDADDLDAVLTLRVLIEPVISSFLE